MCDYRRAVKACTESQKKYTGSDEIVICQEQGKRGIQLKRRKAHWCGIQPTFNLVDEIQVNVYYPIAKADESSTDLRWRKRLIQPKRLI